MKPIAPNTLLQNRYLIVHLIGKGGMGEVYLAVDQRLGSAVALKRTFFSDDEMLGNAFEREARTLARLRHPVLPKVSDHFTEDRMQYLVMEHISGDDLSKRLETAGQTFPLSWVLFWADQLLDALTYLHTHEPPIIHRDIKPQNLKLTDENHIVLLDFGLSKNSIVETSGTTTGGSIVGYTPHYAPMEQIRGTGTDARSDIYSLSATIYQILANKVPPDALTRADSLINGMSDPTKPIYELNKEVSPAISNVILKGMEISQDKRYSTAREMQKALRDAYSRLQADMSAKTIALNTGSQRESLPPAKKQEKVSPHAGQSSFPSSIAPPAPQILESENKFNASSAQNTPDFDATLRYDSNVHIVPPEENKQDSLPKQSDIRTEVFLAGSMPEITAAQENVYSPEKESAWSDSSRREDDFTPEENFSDEDDFGKAESYQPDGTVPLISFGNQADAQHPTGNASSFDSYSSSEPKATTAFTVPDEYLQEDSSAGESVSAAPSSQSKSRALIVVGVLAVLLFLSIGGGAVGWMLLRNSAQATEKTEPTPTAEATVAFEPTPEPTVEAAVETSVETNTETANTNSESSSDNTNTVTETATNTSSTPRPVQQQPGQPTPARTPAPRTTPQTVTVRTPPPAPVKTATPASTPKKIITLQ